MTAKAPWGLAQVAAACDGCGASWLVPSTDLGQPCPCGTGSVEASPLEGDLPMAEQILPAEVDRNGLKNLLFERIGRIRFRASGLDPTALARDATVVWWPRWLLDTSVRGGWRAEVGFEEQVKSNVDSLQGGQWVSREQVQRRIRWEPRAGRVDRRLHNIVVAALADEALAGQVHRGARAEPSTYEPAQVADAWIRCPDLAPAAVSNEAQPGIRSAIAEQVAQAVLARQVRDVTLDLQTTKDRWTLRLHPVWVARYSADNETCTLWIDGVTGRVAGPLMASVRAAMAWTVGLAIAGIVAFVLAIGVGLLGFVLPPLLAVSAILAIGGLILLPAAIAPVASVWMHNAAQRRDHRR